MALRRGEGGKLKIRVHKDNYGWLPRAATFELNSHPTTGAISWEVHADETDGDDEDGFRPTGLMERVSRALEIAGEPQSRNALETSVKGKRDYVRLAIDALIRDGYADENDGPRGSRPVSLVRPYREADDDPA